MEKEIWKAVVGYEGLYEVSSLGNIMSLYDGGHKVFRKRPLKAHRIKGGRMVVDLRKDGKRSTKYLHRVVAIAFIPNPDNLPEVDHIDTVQTNNRVDNLRWCTHKENSNNLLTIYHHSIAAKRRRKQGVYDNQNKPVCQFSLDIQLIKKWPSMQSASRGAMISQSLIWRCCNNKIKTAGGYKWRYYEQEEEK